MGKKEKLSARNVHPEYGNDSKLQMNSLLNP